ncbi:MAG TPA: class I adenylate-forming enzyme family protein [Rhodocyclaceae bacterium]|nr:class I adenylate-forming enzyme family protein [Rhodocyclaceae bacterium]
MTEPPSQGFIDRFLNWADSDPNLVAIEETEGQRLYTYAEAREAIGQLRGQLQAAGVREGDPVLLMLPLGADFILSFFALASLRAVAVTVSPHLTTWELRPILADSRPVGLITNQALHQTHASAFDAIDSLRFSLLSDQAPATTPSLPLTGIGPANPVISCHYTYKGLAHPVGVLHRYHDYTHALTGMAGGLAVPFRPGDVFLDWLPIYAVYSLTMSVLLPLSYGCKVLLMEKVRSNFLQTISDTNARMAPMIPPMFPLLLRQCEGKAVPPLNPDLYICTGGAFLDQTLATRTEQTLGVPVLQGYGTTETLPFLGNHPTSRRPGAIGKLMIAANRAAILDPHGQELPPGPEYVGEIVVMGPSVSNGFLNDPQESAHFFRDGWFHTGDLGWKDDDGFFYFVGRRIGITKIAAQMVDLTEVEQVLARHPAVAKARTLVKNDEELIASVMVHIGHQTDARSLRDHCRQYLSPHKVPKRFNIYPTVAW